MDKKVDYNTIIPRSIAVGSCVVGMMELLVAIFVVICSFVMFGGFCDKLECTDISDAIGLWLGFPLIIPALMGVIVLGTRHRVAVITSGITHVLVLIIAIVHAAITMRDDDDVWSIYVKNNDAKKCIPSFPKKCRCNLGSNSAPEWKELPYGCELIDLGSDLNMILFALSIVTMVLCIISLILSAIGLKKLSVHHEIRMFLFECIHDLHEKRSKHRDIFILKIAEVTTSANPATTTARKQKFKWNDELVEKPRFLFSSSYITNPSNKYAAASFSAISKKENEWQRSSRM